MADRKPHQSLLETFLKELPEEPGQIESGTPKIPRISWPYMFASIIRGGQLVQVPMEQAAQTNSTFLKYTGQSHYGLLEAWCNGQNLTTCNAFAGKCGVAMGFKLFSLGQFEIGQVLYSAGLGHAWVPASSGATPQYGDIFRSTSFHMGVSLDCENGIWHTAESGQGGRSSGCDIIKRKSKPWNPTDVRGWVDVEALLKARTPAPSWLGGWWIVRTRSQNFFYHFGAGGVVRSVPFTMAPKSRFQQPPPSADTGIYDVKAFTNVHIRWNDKDVDEEYQHVYDPNAKKDAAGIKPEKMGGLGPLKGQVTANKINDDNMFLVANTTDFLESIGVQKL